MIDRAGKSYDGNLEFAVVENIVAEFSIEICDRNFNQVNNNNNSRKMVTTYRGVPTSSRSCIRRTAGIFIVSIPRSRPITLRTKNEN